jgi:glycosyltransferase involved in cell wall biosynthesis
MKKPTISVILPAFNAERHIGLAVDSILTQTFVDFELILVDDGSTDSTLSQVQLRAATDKRVRIISRPNKGMIYSLNEGIQEARGGWIARMDADDLSVPRRLEVQLEWVKSNNADIGGTWISTFGHTLPRRRRYYTANDAARFQLLFNSCFAHPSVLGRREVFIANEYSKMALHVEDYELWCRLAAAGCLLTNTPEVLLRYRVHPNQVTQLKQWEQDDGRWRIADKYREQCFSDIPADVHLLIMSRKRLLSREEVAEVVNWFSSELHQARYPLDVLLDNAFIFLSRHAEVGLSSMRVYADACGIYQFKRAMLIALSALGADQSSRLFKLLYAIR